MGDNNNTNKKLRGKFEKQKLSKGVKAVVSEKPGETKKITFYQLSSQIIHRGVKNSSNNTPRSVGKDVVTNKKMSMVLADLPGYGFSFASDEKMLAWRDLMMHFLLHRGKSLKRILLLLDARHGFKKADYDFLNLLQTMTREDNF